MAGVVRVDRESRTFVLTGELDMSNSDELDAALAEADWLDGETVHVDLSGLTFIDSCGLRSLLRAHTKGRNVVIDSPTAQVRKVFEITGLSAEFGVELRGANLTESKPPLSGAA